MSRFTRTFTAQSEHIDVMGHVNNAVWVQWVQDMATAHWEAAARPEDVEGVVWLVVRHEIDYRGNVVEGEQVVGETWIEGPAKGAKSLRRVDFTGPSGKVVVSATTTWAMLDRETLCPMRVRAETLGPFLD